MHGPSYAAQNAAKAASVWENVLRQEVNPWRLVDSIFADTRSMLFPFCLVAWERYRGGFLSYMNTVEGSLLTWEAQMFLVKVEVFPDSHLPL